MKNLLKKASSVCSSRSSEDSGDGWRTRDLPHKTYKQMTSPLTHEKALELLQDQVWKWGAIMDESLSREFERYRRETFAQTIEESFKHKRGWLSRVAEGKEYFRRREIVRRGLEILATKEPRFTRTASIILEYATREDVKPTASEIETTAGQVTSDQWSSSLLDFTAGYGHYFQRTAKAGERPELWTISKDGMYMKWTKDGEGCPDLAKGGKSQSRVWGWTRTDEPVGTLLGGEPRGVYEEDSDDEEREQRERHLRNQGKQAATDAQTSHSRSSSEFVKEARKAGETKETSIAEQDETYLQWLRSGACTLEDPHTMSTAEAANKVLLKSGEAPFSRPDDPPSALEFGIIARTSVSGE